MISILEQIQIHPIWPAVVTVDADDDTVATGDYVTLKDYESVVVLLAFSDGTATSGDINIELYQASDTSGTGAKVLNALETGRIWSKVDLTTLAAVGQWTKETQATADEIYDATESGEKIGMIACEIRAADLDVDNGFDSIRADLDTVTSAKLVCGLYILGNPRVQTSPDLMPSAL